MLFSKYLLSDSLNEQMGRANAAINSYTNEEIMGNDLPLLARNIYEQFKIELLDVLDEDETLRKVAQGKVTINDTFRYNISGPTEVDGVFVSFFHPFSGDRKYFDSRPSQTLISGFPDVVVSEKSLVFTYSMPISSISDDESPMAVIKTRDDDLSTIRIEVGYINKDIKQFNTSLEERALVSLVERREKVQKYFDFSKALEVEIRPSDYQKNILKMSRAISPISHSFNNVRSWCLSDIDYESILEVIKHTCAGFEKTPKTYVLFKEENFRDAIITSLNGIFLGRANAECFRNNGKTDISIEASNRAAFVAECKIWNGAKSVSNALRQLDSYTTWRDCKTCLIYFSRNCNFEKVLECLKGALENDNSIRHFTNKNKNEYECQYASPAHQDQIVKVRVLVFDVHINDGY